MLLLAFARPSKQSFLTYMKDNKNDVFHCVLNVFSNMISTVCQNKMGVFCTKN